MGMFGQGLDLNIDPCTSDDRLFLTLGNNPRMPGYKTTFSMTLGKCKGEAPKGKNTYVILLKEKGKRGPQYSEELWTYIDPKFKKFGKVVPLFKDYDALHKNESKGIKSYQYNHNDPKNTPSQK